jgi:hypothetical protein
VAGGAEVTVVWARAPLAEIANAGSSAANNETAKRCKVILAYLESPNRNVRETSRHRTICG